MADARITDDDGVQHAPRLPWIIAVLVLVAVALIGGVLSSNRRAAEPPGAAATTTTVTVATTAPLPGQSPVQVPPAA